MMHHKRSLADAAMLPVRAGGFVEYLQHSRVHPEVLWGRRPSNRIHLSRNATRPPGST